jgi:hypothetical protein
MKLTKDEILKESEKVFEQFSSYCAGIPNDLFFSEPAAKWSIAQNVQHLITSVKTTTAAYAIPKFMVRIIGGSPPAGGSREYDSLLEKYNQKLREGGKATGRYIPKSISPSAGKQNLLNAWGNATSTYLKFVRNNWQNDQLDLYIAPHPLLGKITLRELCYFTIFHTDHHLTIIRAVVSGQ